MKLPVIVKDKKINNAIYIVIAVVIVFLIWKNRDKIKNFITGRKAEDKDMAEKSANNTPSTGTSSTGAKETVTNDTILKRGSRNDRVFWVQSHFNKYVAPAKNLKKIEWDGIFGEETEKAVKATLGKTSTTWTEFKKHVESKYKNPEN